MKVDNKINRYIEIIENSSVTQNPEGNIILQISSRKRSQLVKLIEDDYREENSLLDHGCTFQGEDVIIDEVILDRIEFMKRFNVIIYLNQNHFLDKNLTMPGNEYQFYIIENKDLGIFSLDTDNEFILGYKRFIKFKEIIKELADFKSNDNILIYNLEANNSCKVIIDKGNRFDNFEKVDKVINIYNSYEENSKYNEEFKLIFKRVTSDILRRNQNNNLSTIIDNFDEFYNELIKSYHLFLSKFSFEEIKNSFYLEKNEYNQILNRDLESTYKVLFTIPVGLGLTLILKFLGSSAFFETLTIFISYSLFLIISMVILIHNCQSTKLNEKSLKLQENKIRIGLSDETIYNEDFKDTFEFFRWKIVLTKILSLFTSIILVILFILFLVKIMIYNETIKNFLQQILLNLENENKMLWFIQLCRLLY